MSLGPPDKSTFEKYFHEYFQMLHHYAYTIVKDSDEAKDIVQSAFLKLWTLHQQLRIEYAVKSYLYKTVYHLSINHVRNTRVRERYRMNKSIVAEHNISINSMFDKEFAVALNRQIDKLPVQCRLVFLKSRAEEKKNAEIAAELGVSVKAVEAQITRALRILRENLGEYITMPVLIFLYNQISVYG